jgi:hypothetical protein
VKAVADTAFLLGNPALNHPVDAKHGDRILLTPGRWLRSEGRQGVTSRRVVDLEQSRESTPKFTPG